MPQCRARQIPTLLFSLAAAFGCSSRAAPISPGGTYDAGPLFQDQTPLLVHHFTVRNPTGRTIHILDKTCSCECTKVDLDEMVLAPGEAAQLSMRVHTMDTYREWSVLCRLETDDPSFKDLTYRLNFRTYPRVSFPGGVIYLGARSSGTDTESSGKGMETSLDVYGPADGVLDRLAKVDAPDPLLVAFDPEPSVDLLEKGGVRRYRYRVTVGLKPGSWSASGVQAGTINAVTSSGRAASTTVSWSSTAPVTVSPTRIHFSPSLPETTQRPAGKVLIRSTDGRDFQILSADGGEEVEVRPNASGGDDQPRVAQVHMVELVLRANRPNERFAAGHITIATDHPEASSIRIEWSAILR